MSHSIYLVAIRIHTNRLVENRNLCMYTEMKYSSLPISLTSAYYYKPKQNIKILISTWYQG